MNRTPKGREARLLGRKTTNSLQHSDLRSRGDFRLPPCAATLGSTDVSSENLHCPWSCWGPPIEGRYRA